MIFRTATFSPEEVRWKSEGVALSIVRTNAVTGHVDSKTTCPVVAR